MKLDDQKIKQILIDENYVTLEDAEKADKSAKFQHISIAEYLINNDLITKDLLGQAIAEFYKIPYANLETNPPSREKVLKIPEDIARKYHIAFFKEEEKEVVIATNNPEEPDIVNLLGKLKKIFGSKKIKFYYSFFEDINSVFDQYRKSLETRFVEIIKSEKRVAPEIIDQILKDAFGYHASDVHFDPQEKDVLVRFRIDGVLHEAGHIPKEYYENILNYVKVLAGLRIDEHNITQDGAIRYSKGGEMIDMRVAIIPIINGEKITIRLLSEYVRSFTLEDLGLSASSEQLIRQAAKKPFGMILVAGPTGSGKTTTLYAIIKILNQPDINITTIEDPVEFKVSGVVQIQVNTQTNLTFAKGLRSILRQDPDIILVGEIRDKETAEIAVNASLTGHLLLSTFHSNDAATSIPRLLNMDVEAFLLASTLNIVIAQRLVRKICDNCRYSFSATRKELDEILPNSKKYFSEKSPTLYKGKGCEVCGGTGFRGRTAIFEIIPITSEMQNLILKNPSTQEIWKLARAEGTRSLFEDGLDKVKNGVTTINELLRVAEPPKNI